MCHRSACLPATCAVTSPGASETGISVVPENQPNGLVCHHSSRESEITIDSRTATPEC
jgi:hypothetical protein